MRCRQGLVNKIEVFFKFSQKIVNKKGAKIAPN